MGSSDRLLFNLEPDLALSLGPDNQIPPSQVKDFHEVCVFPKEDSLTMSHHTET